MTLRTVEWRRFALPAAVVVAAAVVLLWFQAVRVPTVRRQLDEAHLRVLRTVASQIKSRIDRIDEHLELATNSVDQDELGSEQFVNLVRAYTLDLEVQCAGTSESACRSSAEQTIWKAADDRAVGQLLRKGGRDFLYLGYPRAGGVRIVARTDIGKIFADNLPSEREFDAVLLIDADGRVIVQHSAEGLDLARVDWLRAGPAPSSPPAPDAAPAALAAGWRGVGSSTTVSVAGTPYNFYSHPLSLSVRPLAAGAEESTLSAEWTLAGLVASDRVHAASAAVAYDVLAWFGIALLAISAAIPLLKLYLLNPHERLARRDAVWVAASIFALVSLSTLVAVQVYAFEFALPRRLDWQLQAVSDGLISQFEDESRDIGDQLAVFDRELRKTPVPAAASELDRNGNPVVPKIIPSDKASCIPRWACRHSLLLQNGDRIAAMAYPFFELANWLDLDGQQRVKWTTAAGVTPFINSATQRVPYFDQLRKAKLAGRPAPQSGISIALSPTSGKRLTVFWRTIAGAGRGDDIDRLVGQTLVVNPLTFDQPVLPSAVGFAVVEGTGKVLFHSDRTRSMKENFVQESEGDLSLRSHVEQRTCGMVTVQYRAQTHRVAVRPFALSPAAAEECDWRQPAAEALVAARADSPGADSPAGARVTFPAPDWSLLVFQDRSVSDTLMLYTLAVGAALFGLYAAAIVLLCAVAWLLLRHRVLAWLWPDRRQTTAYLWLTGFNAALVAACLWVLYQRPVPQSLLVSGSGVVAALIGAVVVAARRPQPRRLRSAPTSTASATWRPPLSWLEAFLAARASLVFVVAVIPVLAVMHAAISLEQRIYVVHDTHRLMRDAIARATHLQERLSPAVICGSPGNCPAYQAYLTRINTLAAKAPELPPLFPDQYSWERADDARSRFWTNGAARWFLRIVHPPVNDLGVELLPSVLGAVPRQAPPSVAWLIVVPPLLLLSWLLTAYATERMCQPDVVADPREHQWDAGRDPSGAPAADANPGHRLIISPPGCEPSEWNRAAASLDLRVRPLPAVLPDGSPLIVRHLESVLVDSRARRQVLALLESVVYEPARAVWVGSDRDPIAYVEALGRAAPLARLRRSPWGQVELDRWILLLQSFRCQIAGVGSVTGRDESERQPIPDPIAAEASRCPALLPLIRDIGRQDGAISIEAWWSRLVEVTTPYYRSLWASCSREERLVLRQLAEEGLVNPRDRDVLTTLIRKGLVIRDPAFRLMNISFAEFVARAVPARTVAEWEHQIAGTPWSSVRTALITMTAVGAGFVIFTQQQLLSAWVGLLPALAPTIVYPMLREAAGKLFAQRLSRQDAA